MRYGLKLYIQKRRRFVLTGIILTFLYSDRIYTLIK